MFTQKYGFTAKLLVYRRLDYILSTFCPRQIKKAKGSSINDVTALRWKGYQGFCNNSTKALVLKGVTMGGGGVKNYPKSRNVIYGWPLSCHLIMYNVEVKNYLKTTYYLQQIPWSLFQSFPYWSKIIFKVSTLAMSYLIQYYQFAIILLYRQP